MTVFRDASIEGSISKWDVSSVTDMHQSKLCDFVFVSLGGMQWDVRVPRYQQWFVLEYEGEEIGNV